MTPAPTVHLGFEVGTGNPVSIPLQHTFVTGQTQLSGKTTALRAIVERSGRRALAFVTKRGETFEGRRIRPYLPREGDRPIPWRLVESILASALGQRAMKYERLWIVTAAKGATSLQGVRDNVTRLQAKHKSGAAADMYMLLGEYLDLVLPEMRTLDADEVLELQPGLNVMDLAGVGLQLQALVIRAALERINAHETGVLTVFPEAWEFAPRGRSAPAKDEAIAMARKGAVLGNFLLCDSQDLAGVDTVVRQAASVWLLGVQRELNELKRTLQMIPAGVKRPKPEDVAHLELGQFYACWGRHAAQVYVQPAWMNDVDAQRVATGKTRVEQVKRHYDAIAPDADGVATRFIGRTRPAKEDVVNAAEAKRIIDENTRLAQENANLRARLEALENGRAARAAGDELRERDRDAPLPGRGSRAVAVGETDPRRGGHPDFSPESENFYQAVKARLIAEAPGVLARLPETRSELEVTVTRKTITLDEFTLKGRIARLLKDGFFAAPRGCGAVRSALKRTGPDANTANIGRALDEFTRDGFVTDEGSGYREVADMKIRIVEG